MVLFISKNRHTWRAMKTLLFTLLIGIQGIGAYGADDKPETGKSEVGRYQLLSGVIELTTGTTTSKAKGLWKIDTVTGEVWEYVSVLMKGQKPMHGFYRVPTED
jgi:hypothetical protein